MPRAEPIALPKSSRTNADDLFPLERLVGLKAATASSSTSRKSLLCFQCRPLFDKKFKKLPL